MVVRGTVRLTSAGDALGVTLEHPDVQSVSGLVLALLGPPAQLGDVVTWGHVRIEVTAVAGRGVRSRHDEVAGACEAVAGLGLRLRPGARRRSNTSAKC